MAMLAGLGSSAAWAGDLAPGIMRDAGDDGSCETRPTTYPADGEAVPEDAQCTLPVDAAGVVIGEVWSWADGDSVQWYGYPVVSGAGEPPVGGGVVMCGSTDDGQAGAEYLCSPDSSYLLFTVSGVFVSWPTSLADDLHFCQAIRFGDGDSSTIGNACGTVGAPSSGGAPPGNGGYSDASPTPTPTPSEAPTEPAPSPTSTPSVTQPADDDDAGSTSPIEPDGTATTPGPAENEPTLPAASPSTTEAAPVDTATVEDPSTSGPAAPSGSNAGADDGSTALGSESVALVGGSPVPMGFLLVLAGLLACGGYLMLAGPGLLAARRQRR